MPAPGLKLIALDMDGTLTRERSSWEYLHRRMGIWNGQAEKYQELFLAGKIDYEEFCRLDAVLWRNMPLTRITQVLSEIPLQEGAGELIQASRGLGAAPVLLSTGLKILADRLAQLFDFSFLAANELVHRQGLLTGEALVNVSPQDAGKTKEAYLKKIMAEHNISAQETAAVGDSIGDLEMLAEAGLAFAVNPAAKDLKVMRSNLPNLVVVNHVKQIIPVLRQRFG